ncbi:hypothetical protein BDN70DRAFT_602616 [Pholiota conissans]|uniref:Uncharacterized protein n=1 Tax=Pholiota conissans TaxID=109636 RepID=A0A9P6CLG6_9AGAR|nr:hypothetical protein BDN70DRAFT_602616 [Pholiota conissans]
MHGHRIYIYNCCILIIIEIFGRGFFGCLETLHVEISSLSIWILASGGRNGFHIVLFLIPNAMHPVHGAFMKPGPAALPLIYLGDGDVMRSCNTPRPKRAIWGYFWWMNILVCSGEQAFFKHTASYFVHPFQLK